MDTREWTKEIDERYRRHREAQIKETVWARRETFAPITLLIGVEHVFSLTEAARDRKNVIPLEGTFICIINDDYSFNSVPSLVRVNEWQSLSLSLPLQAPLNFAWACSFFSVSSSPQNVLFNECVHNSKLPLVQLCAGDNFVSIWHRIFSLCICIGARVWGSVPVSWEAFGKVAHD